MDNYTGATAIKIKKSVSISILSLLILTICFFGVSYGGDDGPKVLKVKGLYMGMSKDDALKIMESINKSTDTKLDVQDYESGNSGIIGTFVQVYYGKQGKITSIFIAWPQVFEVGSMDFKTFTRQFMDAYSIPTMEGGVRHNSSCYIFNSPHGYELVICENGMLNILKSKNKKPKFD